MINTAERRVFVLELRKAGLDYRTIAQKTIEKFGVESLPKGYSEREAHRDVMRELERINAERSEHAEAIRSMELERLDRMLVAMYQLAVKGDYAAVDRVLRIMAQREKYIAGLAEPKHIRVDHSMSTVELLQQMQNDGVKLTFDQVEEDFGKSLAEELFGGVVVEGAERQE